MTDRNQMSFDSSLAGPSGFNILLECSEHLDASPSTSTSSAYNALYGNVKPNTQRRRVVYQNNPNNQQYPTYFNPPQPTSYPTVEYILNSNWRSAVYNKIDPNIQLDFRSLINLMRSEEHFQPNHHYFTAVQENITAYHREQAIEWIFDVAKEEKCDGNVFLQAVAIIDRFLSSQNIFKHDVQMLAGVALFIASKLKAPHPMNAKKIAYYSDDSCKVEDILSWEMMVITQLEWETESPTAFDFFDQLVARLPVVSTLRNDFQDVVHRCQKMHKLATLFPSVQCAIALYYVSNTSMNSNPQLSLNVKNLLATTFQIEVNLLNSYVPIIQRCLTPGSIYLAPQPESVYQAASSSVAVAAAAPPPPPSAEQTTPAPAPASAAIVEQLNELPLPQTLAAAAAAAAVAPPAPQQFLEQVPQSSLTPTTPLNDSGFSSDVSSPESSAEKKRKFRRSSSMVEDDVTPPKMVRTQ